MRSLFAFALLSSVTALICYDQQSSWSSKPKNTIDCPLNTTQCYKLTVSDVQDTKYYSYGCDVPIIRDMGPHCIDISNGLCGTRGSAVICCCGTDACNSFGLYQPLMAVTFMLFGIFIS